jgi:hypothetical protein
MGKYYFLREFQIKRGSIPLFFSCKTAENGGKRRKTAENEQKQALLAKMK